jgi:hypothetical protein
MRALKVAVFAIGIAAGCLAVGLMFARQHQPSSVPVATITLAGYTKIILSNPDTNVFVFPGRGEWLSAGMILKNKGTASISYGAWGDEPYGWAAAQTPHGSTNGYLAPHFTGGIAVLPPGSNTTFWVCLPPDTLSWQCGFSVETASVRERAISRLCQFRVWPPLQPLCFWSLRSLPNRAGPQVEVKSGPLEVSKDTRAPTHNESLHSPPR